MPKWAFFLLLLTSCAAITGGGRVLETNFPVQPTEAFPDHTELGYILLTFPDAGEGEVFPLVVALHGAGDSGWNYLETWRRDAFENRVMVLAPTLTRGYKYEKEDLYEIVLLVQAILKHYPIDKGRVYLAGASLGAKYARYLALYYPQLWRAAVLIASPPPDEAWAAQISAASFPPVLYVLGEKDTTYLSYDYEERLDLLIQKGIPTAIFTDPTADHEHRREWNASIFEWLKGQG